MDLDKFYAEFRAFRMRVEPMLNEYEEDRRHRREDPAAGRAAMSDELRNEIYKPLDKPEPTVVLQPESDDALRARVIGAAGEVVSPEDKARIETAAGTDLDALAAKYSVRRIGIPIDKE